jgi:hypothetical protein
MKLKCEKCGKEFDVSPYLRKQRFCSKSCFFKSKKARKRCQTCGKEFLISPSRRGKFCSSACYHKHTVGTFKGINNPRWKGGITPLAEKVRKSVLCVQWKQQCFLRDNFVCQKCGQVGGDLEVHHKKRFSVLLQEAITHLPLFTPCDAAMIYTPLWDIKNGITLCRKCHLDKTKVQNQVTGVNCPV